MSDKWELAHIPKTAFFYWGGGTLPYLRYLTIASFRYYNPDWEVTLFTSAIPQKRFISWRTKEQEYSLTCDDYLKHILVDGIDVNIIEDSVLGISSDLAEVHKSDFLRWYLLASFGGVWIDMDILFLKPMNNLYFNLKENENVNTVFCSSGYGHSVGFLMGSPNNSYYNSLWQESHIRYKKETYQSIGVILCNDLFPVPSSIPNSVNMSMDVVYAYDANHVKELYATMYVDRFPDRTIGIHWYGAHQASGKFLNETNGGLVKSNCLLGKYVQEFKDKNNA